MRLWVRLALAMAVVSIAPLVLTGFLAGRIATGGARDLSEQGLAREADATANFVGWWVRQQLEVLHGWTQPYAGQLGATADGEYLVGFLKLVYRATPSVVTVAMVDEDGGQVVPSQYLADPGDRPGGSPERAARLLEKLPLTEVLQSGQVIGDPYLFEPGGVASVPMAVVVAAPAEEGEGRWLVLGAEVAASAVFDDLRERSTNNRGIALVDATGEALFGGDHPLVQADRFRALLGASSNFDHELDDGTRVQGATAPIPDTGWTLVVVEPASVVFAPATAISRQTGGMMVGVIIIMAVPLALWLARSVSRPVAQLRDAAMAMADGQFGGRAQIQQRDEIGELGRAFNHMSERLENSRAHIVAQQQEIEAFNRELQDRVERRTRELRNAQDQLVRSGQLAAVAEVGAGLAHELNNPLAAILGIAQLLQAQTDDEPSSKLLGDLEEQAVRCREVVAAMLRFSSGEVDPAKGPVVDIREVLRDVLHLVRGPFRQRGVVLSLVESETSLPVRIDSVHCTRLLAQVLNALRAGLSAGASVRVGAVKRGEYVEVFLQPDRPVAVGHSQRDDWMASGMGLWVARRLLDQLGGRLEGPGSDPTWRVLLPEA